MANSRPTGWLVILGDTGGEARPGTLLTARPNAVQDRDGIGFITYQWVRDGKAIPGAVAQTYVVGKADEGSTITVRIAYTDGAGNREQVDSKDAIRVPDRFVEWLDASYQLVFERKVDPAGVRVYRGAYRNGVSLDQITTYLLEDKARGAR